MASIASKKIIQSHIDNDPIESLDTDESTDEVEDE
jgi:hypothetical protein